MKGMIKPLLALLYDAALVAIILLVLAAFQHTLDLLPVSIRLRIYIDTIHEWSTVAILTIFLVKSVLRLLISTSEQVDALTQSLAHKRDLEVEASDQKDAT